MKKKQLIKSISNDMLDSYNIKESMTDMDIFLIGKKILEIPVKNNIEKRIISRNFEIIKGILKIKRYNRKPHNSFICILQRIGYFNLSKNDKNGKK